MLTRLAGFFERFEKDYVGRMPQFVGNCAAGAAGDDYFEKIGRRGQIAQEFVLYFGWLRPRDCQVSQNCEDGFFRWRQPGFDSGAAKLQKRIALVETPGDSGASGDGTLETFVGRREILLAKTARRGGGPRCTGNDGH